jgi:predicted nucleic acid-binding protein
LKAVVDTNVVAYYLLGTEPFVDELRAFWHQVSEALAPSSWEAELTNVIWMAVRHDVLELSDGLKRLEFAERLGIQTIRSSSLWEGALSRACLSGVAAYDTLFVELADRMAAPLATFDQRLLDEFPAIAKRPSALVK